VLVQRNKSDRGKLHGNFGMNGVEQLEEPIADGYMDLASRLEDNKFLRI